MLLSTKLFVPPASSSALVRPRLLARLNDGLAGSVTLIAAPAGFGKSTLLSQWLEVCSHKIAWLSLDESDSDPVRFTQYLLTALHQALPKLTPDDTLPPNQQLTSLVNQLADVGDDIILVLDDYHLVDAGDVDGLLAFLLEHAPPCLHTVIATREDPNLPLSRWRVRGKLNEIRARDLRFSESEVQTFWQDADLSPDAIRALDSRTEGWAAGLQLAALSLQGNQNTGAFIRSFTGSHHFVMDYLVEEVLRQQPPDVEHFLLRTAILERLCGDVCDTLTGETAGQEMLERLERANLLIIPLDSSRTWYRYHHLFADVLRVRLRKQFPDDVARLHLQACDWFAEQDFPLEAIRHALAAQAFTRAADVLEQIWETMDLSYQNATWVALAKQLPTNIISERPMLSFGFAWAVLSAGDLDKAETYLQDVEEHLQQGDKQDAPMPINQERFQALPASIASARAYYALTLGDTKAALEHAQHAIAHSTSRYQPSHNQATALMGIAHWMNGDLLQAAQVMQELMRDMAQVNNLTDIYGIGFCLAEIYQGLGRLQQARGMLEHHMPRQPDPTTAPIGLGDLYRALSEIDIEQGQLEQAETHLQQSQTFLRTTPNWEQRLAMTQTRLAEAQEDFTQALSHVDTAREHYTQAPLPLLRPFAAQKAHLWLRQGELAKVAAWVREENISEQPINYMNAFAHLTWVRYLLAQHRRDPTSGQAHTALGWLERLLTDARAGERNGHVIEILLLQALAFDAQGDVAAALEPLQEALTLAEPEGYFQIFLAEGAPLASLLREAQQRGIRSAYVGRLLAELGEAVVETDAGWLEPLSDRERNVLRLLASSLSGPEIAHELGVSLNTIRTHNKNIYSKLGVNSRRAAVRKAQELGLV